VHIPLVFDPSASPAVIPPQFFREFELPRLCKVFAAFKGAGALANWLSIAGPTAPILSYYPQAGVDIAGFDYCVDPLEARQALPRTCLDGNIKPLSFIDGTPEIITYDSSQVLKHFEHHGGFILSSGCEIPPEAKPENVAAMVSAVRRGGISSCQY
jgi:uroporphyrinogen decarboxylase